MTDNSKSEMTEILKSMDEERQKLEALISGLTASQLAAPSTASDWSVKDHFIHLALWQRGVVALLNFQPRWAAMGLEQAFVDEAHASGAGFDAINAQLYELNKNRTWQAVWEAFDAAHRDMQAILKTFTNADLLKPYAHFEPDAATPNTHPIIGWITGDSFEHYAEHYPWIEARIQRDREAGY